MRKFAHTTLFVLAFGMLLFLPPKAVAQKVAVKSNPLYWGTTTPNAGAEFLLGRKTSLSVTAGYNPWKFGDKEENKKLQHWIVRPEFRFWNCEPFLGGFWGIDAYYGRFNMGGVDLPLKLLPAMKEKRYQGWLTGAGITYGYDWYLGPHWNLESSIGVGYAYMEYKTFDCVRCGDYRGSASRHYVGPTKLSLSFVYLFKSKK